MALPPLKFIIVTLLSAMTVIEANLNCTTDEELGTVCSPGDEDFILTKEFIFGLSRPSGITLRGCRITDILPESFTNQSSYSLFYLDLSKNKLNNLQVNVFNELKYLNHLNLSYNIISELPAKIFSSNINLEVLDLRGNSIKQLEVGLFVPVRQLQYLDLAYNALRGDTLHPLILQGNTDVQYLDLSGNDLEGLTSNFFTWAQALEVLNLEGCSLTEVPNLKTFNLMTIKSLSLASNTIRRIDKVNTFNYLRALETINLANNHIQYIIERVFLVTDQLKTIILKNNKLKVIPEELFQDLPNLTELDLSNNLIDRLKVNTFRSSQLSKLNLAGNRFVRLPKNFCANLRNIQVILKQFYFHQNPWECSCLNEVLTEVKKYRIEYNSGIFNGNDPVCVVGNQVKCDRSKHKDSKKSGEDDDDEDDDDADEK